MTKEKQDFTIREGDSVLIEETVEESDGSPRDITSHETQFVLARYNGAEPDVQLTDSDDNVEITDALNGELSITLDPSDTEELAETESKDYYYEIELTDSTGDVHTVTVGTITVEPSY